MPPLDEAIYGFRTWTSSQGIKNQLAYVSFDSVTSKVSVKMKSGVTVALDLNRLSLEDQKWVLDLQSPAQGAAPPQAAPPQAAPPPAEAATAAASDGFRSWTNVQGIAKDLKYLGHDGDLVKFEMRGGRAITMEISKLSPPDQQYILKKDGRSPSASHSLGNGSSAPISVAPAQAAPGPTSLFVPADLKALAQSTPVDKAQFRLAKMLQKLPAGLGSGACTAQETELEDWRRVCCDQNNLLLEILSQLLLSANKNGLVINEPPQAQCPSLLLIRVMLAVMELVPVPFASICARSGVFKELLALVTITGVRMLDPTKLTLTATLMAKVLAHCPQQLLPIPDLSQVLNSLLQAAWGCVCPRPLLPGESPDAHRPSFAVLVQNILLVNRLDGGRGQWLLRAVSVMPVQKEFNSSAAVQCGPLASAKDVVTLDALLLYSLQVMVAKRFDFFNYEDVSAFLDGLVLVVSMLRPVCASQPDLQRTIRSALQVIGYIMESSLWTVQRKRHGVVRNEVRTLAQTFPFPVAAGQNYDEYMAKIASTITSRIPA